MSRKKLKIYGSVGNYAGYQCDNMIITIDGNAGKDVGCYAENCEIYIGGKFKSISKDVGAGTKVYQRKRGNWVG